VRDSGPGPLRYSYNRTTPPSMSHLLDLLEFRLITEPATAALASVRRSNEDLAELQRCVAALERSVAAGSKTKPPEDLGFHLAIARATGNSALMDTSSMISRFYEDDPYLPDHTDIAEHRAILEAVAAATPERAREAMSLHIEHQRKKYLDSNTDNLAHSDQKGSQ
jgi:GntR family transcriptional regulator, transcriptional repressor for pyruvate dehydrogenase complex